MNQDQGNQQNQNVQQTVQNQPSAGQDDTSSGQAQNTSVSNPVGGPHKEQAPRSGAEQPYLQPTEQNPVLSPEVQEAGVEVVTSQPQPKIPVEVKQATGLEPAKDAVPVSTEPSGIVQLPNIPFKESEVDEIYKHTKPNDSKHWLVLLTKYVIDQFKSAHKN